MLGKNASMISRQCRICRGSFSRQIRAREMMFGTRKKFDYLQCSECGCLQIAKIPSDMSDYYIENDPASLDYDDEYFSGYWESFQEEEE